LTGLGCSFHHTASIRVSPNNRHSETSQPSIGSEIFAFRWTAGFLPVLSDCCKKQRLQRRRVPAALSGSALWLTLMIALTVINYGYPIAQLLALKGNAVPAVYSRAGRPCLSRSTRLRTAGVRQVLLAGQDEHGHRPLGQPRLTKPVP
jgi:hypothetical protein